MTYNNEEKVLRRKFGTTKSAFSVEVTGATVFHRAGLYVFWSKQTIFGSAFIWARAVLTPGSLERRATSVSTARGCYESTVGFGVPRLAPDSILPALVRGWRHKDRRHWCTIPGQYQFACSIAMVTVLLFALVVCESTCTGMLSPTGTLCGTRTVSIWTPGLLETSATDRT